MATSNLPSTNPADLRKAVATSLSERAVKVFGDSTIANRWMRAIHPELDNSQPFAVAGEPVLRQKVDELMVCIAFGIYR